MSVVAAELQAWLKLLNNINTAIPFKLSYSEGYSDILYKPRLGPFFEGQNFEFQYFWGVFRKLNIFLV